MESEITLQPLLQDLYSEYDGSGISFDHDVLEPISSNEEWLGIISNGQKVRFMFIKFVENTPYLTNNITMNVSKNEDLPDIYNSFYKRVYNMIQERNFARIIIRATEPPVNKKSILSIELRGVLIAAASSQSAKVNLVRKSDFNRRKQHRSMNDYIRDNNYWENYLQIPNLSEEDKSILLLMLYMRDKQVGVK